MLFCVKSAEKRFARAEKIPMPSRGKAMVLECMDIFCVGKEVQLWESISIQGVLCGEHVEHVSRLWLKLFDIKER